MGKDHDRGRGRVALNRRHQIAQAVRPVRQAQPVQMGGDGGANAILMPRKAGDQHQFPQGIGKASHLPPRAAPTMQPSATASTSATVACFTPVFARTGVVGNTRLTSSRSTIRAASPVMAPETSTASGIEENTAERARSGSERGSSDPANSAETLYSFATPPAPIRWA